MDYLTLRRIHSLDSKEIAHIFSSYGYLCQQNKCVVNSSFVKTFEYVIVNKMHELNQDELSKCLVALIRMQKMSLKTKIISN